MDLYSVTNAADNLANSLHVLGAEASQPVTKEELYQFAKKFAAIMHDLERELKKD